MTGNQILRILKAKGLAPDLPEDLYHLIKKAVSMRKHLERNRKVYMCKVVLLRFFSFLNLLQTFLMLCEPFNSDLGFFGQKILIKNLTINSFWFGLTIKKYVM